MSTAARGLTNKIATKIRPFQYKRTGLKRKIIKVMRIFLSLYISAIDAECDASESQTIHAARLIEIKKST